MQANAVPYRDLGEQQLCADGGFAKRAQNAYQLYKWSISCLRARHNKFGLTTANMPTAQNERTDTCTLIPVLSRIPLLVYCHMKHWKSDSYCHGTLFLHFCFTSFFFLTWLPERELHFTLSAHKLKVRKNHGLIKMPSTFKLVFISFRTSTLVREDGGGVYRNSVQDIGEVNPWVHLSDLLLVEHLPVNWSTISAPPFKKASTLKTNHHPWWANWRVGKWKATDYLPFLSERNGLGCDWEVPMLFLTVHPHKVIFSLLDALCFIRNPNSVTLESADAGDVLRKKPWTL